MANPVGVSHSSARTVEDRITGHKIPGARHADITKAAQWPIVVPRMDDDPHYLKLTAFRFVARSSFVDILPRNSASHER